MARLARSLVYEKVPGCRSGFLSRKMGQVPKRAPPQGGGCPPLCGFFLPAPYMGGMDEKWQLEKAELISKVLEPARKTIKQIAKDRYPKDPKTQNLCRVQLTNEVLKAMKIYLNWTSAEALYTGTEIAEIGAAIGGSQNQSNVRRKLPHMKAFENAIVEANDRKKPVDVTIDGWTIQINPDN